jgi:hypothetical protein
MLLIKNITDIPMLSDEWYQARLACFTSSEKYCLMSDKFLTVGAMSYIKRKIFEELSGLPSKEQVNTISTEHGHKYESEGIMEYGKSKGLEFVVTQKLIKEPGSRFGSTPDFIIVHNKSSDGLSYNVSTGEIKCPQGEAFIGLAMCKTPEDVKKLEPKYYWQVIDQMAACDALIGHFVVYNPFVRVGKLHSVEFRKINLVPEFKLLKERNQLTIAKFEEIRDLFLNKL